MNKLIGCIGLVVITIVTIVYATFTGGLVIAALWGWFMVPIFKLPELTIMQAIGVGYVVSYIVTRVDPNIKTEENSPYLILAKSLAISTGKAVVFLVFGYIIKSLM